jgi:hypothetical protein
MWTGKTTGIYLQLLTANALSEIVGKMRRCEISFRSRPFILNLLKCNINFNEIQRKIIQVVSVVE